MSGRARNAAGLKVMLFVQPFVFRSGTELLVGIVIGSMGIVGSGVPGVHVRLRPAVSRRSELYADGSPRGLIAPLRISVYVAANCTRYGSCARNAVRFVAKSLQNWLKRSTCVATANWLYVKRFPSRGDRYVVFARMSAVASVITASIVVVNEVGNVIVTGNTAVPTPRVRALFCVEIPVAS